jgi:hypothetical protein
MAAAAISDKSFAAPSRLSTSRGSVEGEASWRILASEAETFTAPGGSARPHPLPRAPAIHSPAHVRTPSTPLRWQKSPSVSAARRSAL